MYTKVHGLFDCIYRRGELGVFRVKFLLAFDNFLVRVLGPRFLCFWAAFMQVAEKV